MFINNLFQADKSILSLALFCMLTVSVSGCTRDESMGQSVKPQTTKETTAGISSTEDYLTFADSIAWAINLGGPEHLSQEGIHYQADSAISSDISGEFGTMDKVLGTQNEFLYKSHRVGDIQIRKPIENGAYDITFKFSEPLDISVGERVFNVLAEGEEVIADMDIRLARDNNTHSSVIRTATDIDITDGYLDIGFEALAGAPMLNALIVRKKPADPRTWKLVWSDEFNYQGSPDPDKWSFNEWPARKVNDEDQTYTRRAKNVRVDGEKLIIEAHMEDFNDAKYSSGRIHSQGKGDFLYGKAEIRAKLAAGQGTWSAIWMLPADPYKNSTTCEEGEDWQGSETCDAWPSSGEIDIMEYVGYDPQTIHGTVHNRAYFFINQQQRKASIEGKNVEDEFHTYSLEWNADDITIFYDGVPYFYYKNQGEGWQSWPYDQAYHIILNLAVGGAWGRAGGPIDDSIFPARMEVDYVRVYQLDSD